MTVWRPVADQPRGLPRARPRHRPGTGSGGAGPAGGSGAGTVGASLSALPVWQLKLAMMAACTLPGILIRLSGAHVPPPLGIAVFGGAVTAAAFMLASAAEAAEIDLSPGIAVAGVA